MAHFYTDGLVKKESRIFSERHKDTVAFGLDRNVIDMLNQVNNSYLFSNICYEIENEDIAFKLSDVLNKYKQKVNDCSKLIDKLDELVRSLNSEKDIIQDDIIRVNNDIESLNNVEHNPVLRTLHKIYQINGINNNLVQCSKAIDMLSVKTEELERLYSNAGEKKKKGLKHILLEYFK